MFINHHIVFFVQTTGSILHQVSLQCIQDPSTSSSDAPPHSPVVNGGFTPLRKSMALTAVDTTCTNRRGAALLLWPESGSQRARAALRYPLPLVLGLLLLALSVVSLKLCSARPRARTRRSVLTRPTDACDPRVLGRRRNRAQLPRTLPQLPGQAPILWNTFKQCAFLYLFLKGCE